MKAASATGSLALEDPRLAGRTGAGVEVAVLDSGVNPANPHVGATADGIAVHPGGGESDDALDRLGHGTAVAAAILEKAPGVRLRAVRIFHDTLSTDTPTLIRAVDRATELGARLVNLSLGTAEEERRDELGAAVERAHERGALVVSAREHRGRRWWPGSHPGVIGVLLDWSCSRHELRLMRGPEGVPVFRASGLPRPIPGVPAARNLKGISFAVANVTGLLGLLLEGEPEVRTAERVAERVEHG